MWWQLLLLVTYRYPLVIFFISFNISAFDRNETEMDLPVIPKSLTFTLRFRIYVSIHSSMPLPYSLVRASHTYKKSRKMQRIGKKYMLQAHYVSQRFSNPLAILFPHPFCVDSEQVCVRYKGWHLDPFFTTVIIHSGFNESVYLTNGIHFPSVISRDGIKLVSKTEMHL